MEHTIPYNLSKDYKLLFEIVKAGNRIETFARSEIATMKQVQEAWDILV